MSYNRTLVPLEYSSAHQLTSDMVGIGILLSGKPSKNPNVENTLIAASLEGVSGDFRTLSLLIDWIEIHHERIIANRLFKLAKQISAKKVRCFWAAIGRFLKKDHRFQKLSKIYEGPRLDLLPTGTDFLIGRSGEDSRFADSCFRVPHNTLRHRKRDILTPEQLARRHKIYYWRIIIGPTYRADMWALLTLNPKISASELARRTFGSFASAWQAKKDLKSIGR